jgi:hypothetical protein
MKRVAKKKANASVQSAIRYDNAWMENTITLKVNIFFL